MRELQLLAEDLREVVEGDLDLERVLALLLARLALAVGVTLLAAVEGVALVALALTDAARLLVAEAKLGDVDLRHGDRHGVFALPAEQLAVRDVFAQVLPYAPLDDVAEARVILIDVEGHRAA